MKNNFFLLFFLILLLNLIFLTSSKFQDNHPTLVFNHYNSTLKSYVSYILFENKQSVVNYKENIIYNFDYTSISINQEIYNLKGLYFPSVYIPLKTEQEKKNKGKKVENLGSLAQIIRNNQIMYLFDYGTPNFYRHLDYNLRGIIVAIEDNVQNLLNNLYNAQKIEYKPYLDYVKSFANINKDFELILCYNIENEIFFEFLNTKNNKIKVISIDKYYRFQSSEKEYPKNEIFTF
ncbi:MAG: hypothetical protein ACK4GR_01875 [bacterium]